MKLGESSEVAYQRLPAVVGLGLPEPGGGPPLQAPPEVPPCTEITTLIPTPTITDYSSPPPSSCNNTTIITNNNNCLISSTTSCSAIPVATLLSSNTTKCGTTSVTNSYSSSGSNEEGTIFSVVPTSDTITTSSLTITRCFGVYDEVDKTIVGGSLLINPPDTTTKQDLLFTGDTSSNSIPTYTGTTTNSDCDDILYGWTNIGTKNPYPITNTHITETGINNDYLTSTSLLIGDNTQYTDQHNTKPTYYSGDNGYNQTDSLGLGYPNIGTSSLGIGITNSTNKTNSVDILNFSTSPGSSTSGGSTTIFDSTGQTNSTYFDTSQFFDFPSLGFNPQQPTRLPPSSSSSTTTPLELVDIDLQEDQIPVSKPSPLLGTIRPGPPKKHFPPSHPSVSAGLNNYPSSSYPSCPANTIYSSKSQSDQQGIGSYLAHSPSLSYNYNSNSLIKPGLAFPTLENQYQNSWQGSQDKAADPCSSPSTADGNTTTLARRLYPTAAPTSLAATCSGTRTISTNSCHKKHGKGSCKGPSPAGGGPGYCIENNNNNNVNNKKTPYGSGSDSCSGTCCCAGSSCCCSGIGSANSSDSSPDNDITISRNNNNNNNTNSKRRKKKGCRGVVVGGNGNIPYSPGSRLLEDDPSERRNQSGRIEGGEGVGGTNNTNPFLLGKETYVPCGPLVTTTTTSDSNSPLVGFSINGIGKDLLSVVTCDNNNTNSNCNNNNNSNSGTLITGVPAVGSFSSSSSGRKSTSSREREEEEEIGGYYPKHWPPHPHSSADELSGRRRQNRNVPKFAASSDDNDVEEEDNDGDEERELKRGRRRRREEERQQQQELQNQEGEEEEEEEDEFANNPEQQQLLVGSSSSSSKHRTGNPNPKKTDNRWWGIRKNRRWWPVVGRGLGGFKKPKKPNLQELQDLESLEEPRPQEPAPQEGGGGGGGGRRLGGVLTPYSTTTTNNSSVVVDDGGGGDDPHHPPHGQFYYKPIVPGAPGSQQQQQQDCHRYGHHHHHHQQQQTHHHHHCRHHHHRSSPQQLQEEGTTKKICQHHHNHHHHQQQQQEEPQQEHRGGEGDGDGEPPDLQRLQHYRPHPNQPHRHNHYNHHHRKDHYNCRYTDLQGGGGGDGEGEEEEEEENSGEEEEAEKSGGGGRRRGRSRRSRGRFLLRGQGEAVSAGGAANANITMESCTQCLKNEFKPENAGLNHEDPSVFVRSQWPLDHRLYVLYRIVVALGFIAWIIADVIDETEKFYKDRFWIWFIFATNWSFILLTVTTIFEAICSTYYLVAARGLIDKFRYHKEDADQQYFQEMPICLKIQWLLYNLGANTAIVITISYWSFIFFMEHSKFLMTNMSKTKHMLNTVYVVMDIFISATPIRIFHMLFPIMLGSIYAIFNATYFLNDGTILDGRHYAYNVLNWNVPAEAIVTCILCIAQTIFSQIILFHLAALRNWIYSKIYKPCDPIPEHDSEMLSIMSADSTTYLATDSQNEGGPGSLH